MQVRHAPINFNDWMVVWSVYYWKPQPPETLGNEGAGVVLAVGEGVDSWAPGMPVVLSFMREAGCEVVLLDENGLANARRGAA